MCEEDESGSSVDYVQCIICGDSVYQEFDWCPWCGNKMRSYPKLSRIKRGDFVATPNGAARFISTWLDTNDSDAREPEGKYALVIHSTNQEINPNLCYHIIFADTKTGWIVAYKAEDN